MSLDSDLKKIEKKYLKAITESGIFELLIGSFILGSAILKYMEINYHFYLYLAIITLGFLILNSKVIRPRTGIIKFKRPPNSRIIKMVVFSILMIGGGFLGLYIFKNIFKYIYIIPWNPLLELMQYTIFSLWILPSFFHVMSHVSRNIRYSILGLVAGVALFLEKFFYDFMGNYVYGLISLCTIGAVLFLNGAILMMRFLRKYPKPPKFEDINDK